MLLAIGLADKWQSCPDWVIQDVARFVLQEAEHRLSIVANAVKGHLVHKKNRTMDSCG